MTFVRHILEPEVLRKAKILIRPSDMTMEIFIACGVCTMSLSIGSNGTKGIQICAWSLTILFRI